MSGESTNLFHLDQHLQGVGPPLLLLAGEPGIGKTRLLREATERASEAGWAVLEDGCHRRSDQEPYAPLLGALADHLRRQSPAQLRVALEGCAWLVRLLPELAEQALVPLPHWTLPPEQERRLMFAAMKRYLANVAGPRGTLLVLDNLQWAGARARADLEDALARFREMRITYHLDFTLAELGRLCQAEGQREEAAQYLQEALALCEPMMNLEWLRQTQSVLAEGDLLEGHPEQARRRLMPVLDRYTDQEADVTTLLPLLAWAQLDLGNHAGAEATLTQALARARGQQMRPALTDALRVQAQVRLQQKHWEAAQHALEEALELCQAMPSSYAEAKALYVYGRLHQAKGEPDLARKRLEAALAILNCLGERLYAEQVERAGTALER